MLPASLASTRSFKSAVDNILAACRNNRLVYRFATNIQTLYGQLDPYKKRSKRFHRRLRETSACHPNIGGNTMGECCPCGLGELRVSSSQIKNLYLATFKPQSAHQHPAPLHLQPFKAKPATPNKRTVATARCRLTSPQAARPQTKPGV